MTRLPSCLALALLALSCQGIVEGSDHGFTSTPIINGVAPNRPEHAAVASLHAKYVNTSNFNPSPFCSGTLIAPDVVLTAAHCLTASGKKLRAAASLAVSFSDDPSA